MSRLRSFSATWLGLAVALTAATQLRPGIPLGPGELMLAMWVGASLVMLLMRARMVVASTWRAFLVFWGGAFVLLLAGWLSAALMNHTSASAVRDFVAYMLGALLVFLLAVKPGGEDDVRVAARVALFVGTIPLFFLLLVTFPARSFGPIEAWFGWRFRGWSENPNQVALAMSVVPFLALHGYHRSRCFRGRAAYAVLIFAAIVVGLACGSDGVFLGWVSAAALMAGHSWLLGLRRGRAPLGRGAVLYVILPVVVLAGLAGGGYTVYQRVQSGLEKIYEEGDQGSVRVTLWEHALQATAYSPIVGLGPGGHSGTEGPFGEMEAHNTMIDWASATGLFGVLLFLGLLASVARRALTVPAVLAALAALTVFGMSGFHLRHPIFWLYLLFIAVLGEEGRREAGGAARVARAPRSNAPAELALRPG